MMAPKMSRVAAAISSDLQKHIRPRPIDMNEEDKDMTITTSAAAGDPLLAPKAAALAKARVYPRGKQSPLCDGCLSVIEFCGNEQKICGNTNGLCPVHCVKRWPSLA